MSSRSKVTRLLVLAGSLLAVSSFDNQARALVLDFDDLSSETELANYGGFTWSNAYALDVTAPNLQTVGYGHGLVSGSNVIENIDSHPLTVSSSSAFTF